MTQTTKAPAFAPTFARRMDGMRASEIRELLKLIEKPGVVSFAGGIPDPTLFPQDEIRAAYDRVLSDPVRAGRALQYSTSEGDDDLRAWIVDYMAAKGTICSIDNTLITNGSQQGLEFLGRLFLSPGDTALVAAPTYLGALQAFSACQPHYETLRLSDTNLNAEVYAAETAARGGRTGFAYVVPEFANPTGETMTKVERLRLIELAAELDAPIIEDSPYSELRYEGVAPPTIQSLDIARSAGIEASRVIHCGSFSKVFTPGLRIGWVCAATPVIQKLTLIKQASDLNASRLNQMVVHELASTMFDEQVAKARESYVRKRDAMLGALAQHMPEGVTWSKPEGGMFIWMVLPEGFDAAELLPRAVEEAGAAYVPGEAFFADRSGPNTLRLSYSLPSVEDIEAGIARLGALLRQTLS
jgi:DNA-binding transcriptional MocR family regulator